MHNTGGPGRASLLVATQQGTMRLKPRREAYQTRRRSNSEAAAADRGAAAADAAPSPRGQEEPSSLSQRSGGGDGKRKGSARLKRWQACVPCVRRKVGPLARGWARGRVRLWSFQNPAQSTPTNGWWPQRGTKSHI